MSVVSRYHRVLYLIMALCAPVLHVTSWQKAVNAVSGEEIFEEVMFDRTLISLVASSCSGSVKMSVSVGAGEGTGAGKQVSVLTGALG